MTYSNPNLLGQPEAILAVGSGDLLGCFLVILIIPFVANAACLFDLLRFEYKNYRQRNQGCREKENADRKINHPLGLNLGVFGKPNLQGGIRTLKLMRINGTICKISEDVISAGAQKHILPLKHIVTVRNFFCRISHKCDVRKQPNVES
jgi:hypothetical protein